MKKIVLTVVAMLCMTMAFAEGENVNNTNEMEAYTISINTKKLSETLGLNRDQAEAVADIEKNFSAAMMNVGQANKESRPEMFQNALKTNLGYMHSILNDKAVSQVSAVAQHDSHKPWIELLIIEILYISLLLSNRGRDFFM